MHGQPLIGSSQVTTHLPCGLDSFLSAQSAVNSSALAPSVSAAPSTLLILSAAPVQWRTWVAIIALSCAAMRLVVSVAGAVQAVAARLHSDKRISAFRFPRGFLEGVASPFRFSSLLHCDRLVFVFIFIFIFNTNFNLRVAHNVASSVNSPKRR